ncbi:SMI1/KNR4 family protein [Ktedonobacter racemifer]|uniref:Cell wall assembly/cell proliferation coordinating protein, KNR4 n=1 Tax=Ktedonobacter racemifer DSM 44963 TaxID=485913 RepID=D6TDK0_KTERA|nr:SMI1/KNR4 family protein [Ktedonobacter racemifer]EFH88345.1 Cell wall assembly/cell proliferation coordinating protein, KNR4 [Ktedonobacter racemifer DSM 44963]
MQGIWKRIEAWLKDNAPEILDTLIEGATDDDLQEIEAEMGMRLPEGVKASWQTYNGTFDAFIDGWRLHNLDEVVQQRQFMIDLFRDNEEWWNPKWLPLASDGCGDMICIDLAPVAFYDTPSPQEQVGQIFVFWHDDVDHWLAPSFQALFAAFTEHLEAGKYKIDEFGGLKSDNLLFWKPLKDA